MRTYPRGKNLPVWAGLVLCLLIGFVFVCIGTGIELVEREELTAVTIRLDRCVVAAGDFDRISLLDGDGNRYQIHAANGKEDLARKLEAVAAGTELELLLHPEEDYVLGIYEDGTPILDWQTAQQEIKDEDLAFTWLGILVVACGIVGSFGEKFSKREKIMLDKMETRWYYNGADWLTANRKLVLIVVRVHLFPSRTQKLSSLTPTIVAW